jgi:peptide/nickel transport system ATP-binding protein
MEVLGTQGLSKVFMSRSGIFHDVKTHALDNVTVSLQKNEIVGIVGASGSGKSTLAKILVFLYKPTGGKIIFEGNDVTGYGSKEIKKYRQSVQMVFQDPYASLDPNHNVEWHIKRPLLLSSYDGDIDERIDEILNMVTLNPTNYYRNKFPHQLSGGQRQRVYLARVLALKPKVLIADEPVSMLDVSVRVEILALINKLRDEQGISVMYITHDVNTVSLITDRIYVMQNGTVVESGNTSDVISNPTQSYTRDLIEAAPNPNKRI